VAAQATARALARPWINAVTLAAATDTAAGMAMVILGRMLSIQEPDPGALAALVFLLAGGALSAMAMSVYALLTGQVLHRKLLYFPETRWIIMNALFGLALGLFTYSQWLGPPANASDAELTPASGLGLMLVALFFMSLLGGVQALVLRRVARGTGLWFGCSAATGLAWLLVLPIYVYVPQADMAREFATTAVAFVVDVVSGLIVLPALLHLRPRWGRDIRTLFE
jgi:hypothetical protein